MLSSLELSQSNSHGPSPHSRPRKYPSSGRTQRGYNITGSAITGCTPHGKSGGSLPHASTHKTRERNPHSRVLLLHRARVVCALVKKLSLPPYIHIGTGERFTEKLLRRLCGPGSRGSRETLCMYKLPPLNSAKGNALRNFLYFHANSLLLFLRSPTFFFFFFLSSLPPPSLLRVVIKV